MRTWVVQWKAEHAPSGDKFKGFSIIIAETRDEAESIARDQPHMKVYWVRSVTFDDTPGLKYQDYDYC